MENIGSTIRNIRKQKGLTQIELADKSKITQTYLSQIEKGIKTPKVEIIDKISSALDIPSEVLCFLSLKEDNVSEEKREAYKIIEPAIKVMINELFLQD